MTRLPFAAAVLLALSHPAGATAPAEPAVTTLADTLDADYLAAAKLLFKDDAVQQQAFIFRLHNSPGLSASIRASLIDARKAGGGDAAVTAALLKNPDAVQAQTDVPTDVLLARNALEAGLKGPKPAKDFTGTPLVGALMTGLGAKDPADLFKTLNVAKYGGPLATSLPAATQTVPCVKSDGTARGDLDATAANHQIGEGQPCTRPEVDSSVVQPDLASAKPPIKSTGGDPVSTVTDRHMAPPPSPVPGSDKGPAASTGGGGGLPFSMGTMTSVGLMAGMGALIGTFGGPVGIAAGAILGGLFGLFLSTRKSDGGGSGD